MGWMFNKRALAGYAVFWLLFLGAIALSSAGIIPGLIVYVAFFVGIFAVVGSLIAAVSSHYSQGPK